MERPVKLSESTLIPLGASIIIFGAAAWITTVWAQGQENKQNIIEIKSERKDDMEYIRLELKEINNKLTDMKRK